MMAKTGPYVIGIGKLPGKSVKKKTKPKPMGRQRPGQFGGIVGGKGRFMPYPKSRPKKKK